MNARGPYRAYSPWPILVVLLIIGGLLGTWMGETIVRFWPGLAILGQKYSLGIPNFSLDLGIMSMSLGLIIRLNILGILGLIGAFLLYRRI